MGENIIQDNVSDNDSNVSHNDSNDSNVSHNGSNVPDNLQDDKVTKVIEIS